MRYAKSLLVAAAFAVTICSVPSNAQMDVDKNRSYFSPDQQFGFGINNAGLHVQYAMGPAFQIGLNLNLDFQTGQSTSSTAYNFGPYAKFLFSGDVIKPYAMASVGVIKPNTGSANVIKGEGGIDSVSVMLPETEARVYLALGGEHYFNQNVGVYGHVNLVDAKLSPSPSVTKLGLRGGVVGIEFFF